MASSRLKRKRAEVNYSLLDDDVDSLIQPEAIRGSRNQSVNGEANDSNDEFSMDRKGKIKGKPKSKKNEKNEKNKKNETAFPFLSLPAEIRNMIYKHLLVEPVRDLTLVTKNNCREVIRGHMVKRLTPWGNMSWSLIKHDKKDNGHTRLHPALLAVNRQIKNEASPVLYGQVLHFETPHVLCRFLARTGTANRLMLRELVLYGWNNDRHTWREAVDPAFVLLATATNVKRLTLDRRVSSPSDSDPYSITKPLATSFGKDIQIWRETVEAVNGKGAAKRILNFTKLNFGSQEQIDKGNKMIKIRQGIFFEALKF